MRVEGGDLREASISIEKNGNIVESISAGNGTFSISLDFNSQYILSFEKNGFVSKKLSFDTHAPSEGVEDGFHPFDFTISLFKQYDDVNIVVFNQPVGVIKYYETIDDFDYDTDYTKSIQSRLQKALEEVENAKRVDERREKIENKETKKSENAKAKAELKSKKEKEAEQKAQEGKEARRADEKEDKDDKEKRKLAEANAAKNKQLRAKARTENEARKREEALERLAKLKEVTAQVHSSSEGRREIITHNEYEESPIRDAKTVEQSEKPVFFKKLDPDIVRNEELIVEDNKIITKIILENGNLSTEYQKVVHKFGATYYFKNGDSCTKQIYEIEAVADN